MKEKESNAKGIASMILGILSLLLFLMPYFGLPLAIVGLVLAGQQKKSNPTGQATAGNILGIIGIVINSIMLLIVLFGLLIFSNMSTMMI